MRAIFFRDDECPPCDDAQKAIDRYIEANEVEVMDIQEGLRQFDLGDPEGVPFIAFISPSMGKCINKLFFHEEGGEMMVQAYPSVVGVEGSGKAEKEEPEGGEADQG